jgi:hypothetical protein
MNVNPTFAYVAQRPAKGEAGGIHPIGRIRVGAAPVDGVVSLARLVGDGDDIEQRINGGGVGGVGLSGVIDSALQFFNFGQTPVVVTGCSQVLAVSQRVIPVQPRAEDCLGPAVQSWTIPSLSGHQQS